MFSRDLLAGESCRAIARTVAPVVVYTVRGHVPVMPHHRGRDAADDLVALQRLADITFYGCLAT